MAAERESRVTEAAAAHALDFERPVIDLERKIEELVRVSGDAPALRPQIRLLEERARELQQEIFADLSAWQKVQLSRHPARPYTLDYIERLIEGFVELHGDRRRLRHVRGDAGAGARPPEGTQHQGEGAAQLRPAQARGLPQGDAPDGA